jgi:hypothetical protein
MPHSKSNATTLLDQIGHTCQRPQIGVIPKRLWPAFEIPLNSFEIGPAQPRLTTRTSGLLQSCSAGLFDLLGPAAHRLSVHTDLARNFCLV